MGLCLSFEGVLVYLLLDAFILEAYAASSLYLFGFGAFSPRPPLPLVILLVLSVALLS
jgi:hypothetical protein